MQLGILLLCSVLIGLANNAVVGDTTPETVELNPPVGRVRGSLMTSRLGKTIYAFRGLRYAEPPVGDLRFKQAVPVSPWKDVFDATQDGPSCPEPGGKNVSEDCLRLNVYTTKLPSATKSGNSENPKRPILIYFHPGAFYGLSGQSILVGPQYFMDQDLVFVTVNNRIGSLGFISTGDAQVPGNLGFKDQVQAMRWVQRNIATFGGDPNSVTISGYSAGSWSVLLHLLSPMTKGLFHRAISMSGSPIRIDPSPHHQNDLAKEQAELVGCPTDSTDSILGCLKTKPAKELGDTYPRFFKWRGFPPLLWSAVVEPDVPGVERFLTAQPADLIRQGKIHSVPYICGVTKDEFSGAVVPWIEEAREGNTTVFEELNNEWEKYAPLVIGYKEGTVRSNRISKTLRKMYFKDQPISLATVDKLAEMIRDTTAFSAHRTVDLMAQNSKKPVYFYEFRYQGRYSFQVWPKTNKPYGVVHHDDLLYIVYNSYYPYFNGSDPEVPTVMRMTSMWANFAKTGEPIPRNNPLFTNVTWTPFTMEKKKYLEIGDQLVLKSNYRGNRMSEWDRLIPLEDSGEQCVH